VLHYRMTLYRLTAPWKWEHWHRNI